jgi:hypothetical protein
VRHKGPRSGGVFAHVVHKRSVNPGRWLGHVKIWRCESNVLPSKCVKVWQKGINIEDNEEERLAETKTYNE